MAEIHNIANFEEVADQLRKMDDGELMGCSLVQQGAIHAVSTLIGHGASVENAAQMLESLREQADIIRAEFSRRGKPGLFDEDQIAAPAVLEAEQEEAYAALPKPAGEIEIQDGIDPDNEYVQNSHYEDAYTSTQMRAYADAHRAAPSAQADAPAPKSRYGDIGSDLEKKGPLVVTLENVNIGQHWHATSNHSGRISCVYGDTPAQALSMALNDAGAAPMSAGGDALTQAARDVLAERRRQVEAEGRTPEHDDEHDKGELAVAAALYALRGKAGPSVFVTAGSGQTWGAAELLEHVSEWIKPCTPRRALEKSGALILAEIERIDRAAFFNNNNSNSDKTNV